MKPVSPRLLTATYAAAFLIIAALSVVSHTILGYALHSDEGSAAIINQAGRQRMLSQRIAGLAAEYRLGDAAARDALRDTTAEFETSHAALAQASRTNRLSGDRERQLQAIYFGGNTSLDAEVRGFVSDAHRLADLSPDDPAFQPILARLQAQARRPLLAGLDAVVSVLQAESEHRTLRLEYLQWAILSIVLATLMVEALAVFRPMIRRIVAYTSELLRLATTDSLTGAANRRSFIERCEAEVVRAQRYGRPASLLMLDVDHFKAINDTAGHAAGDEVLKAIGGLLSATLRRMDIWGRLGGEEFAVLLVETDMVGAAAMAERIREAFAAHVIQYKGKEIRFTVSIGVTSLFQGTAGFESALGLADRLMYRAKQTGRNRVVSEIEAEALS